VKAAALSLGGQVAHQRRGAADCGEYREAASESLISAQRDPSRLAEDFPSDTDRPRSSCAGTTDTDTFAEYKSASHGKFGRSTSASRIEDKTEQKRAAEFPFVRPFGPPSGWPPTVPALAQKTRLSWLWIAGVRPRLAGERGNGDPIVNTLRAMPLAAFRRSGQHYEVGRGTDRY
jgi:hypothetical protein